MLLLVVRGWHRFSVETGGRERGRCEKCVLIFLFVFRLRNRNNPLGYKLYAFERCFRRIAVVRVVSRGPGSGRDYCTVALLYVRSVFCVPLSTAAKIFKCVSCRCLDSFFLLVGLFNFKRRKASVDETWRAHFKFPAILLLFVTALLVIAISSAHDKVLAFPSRSHNFFSCHTHRACTASTRKTLK